MNGICFRAPGLTTHLFPFLTRKDLSNIHCLSKNWKSFVDQSFKQIDPSRFSYMLQIVRSSILYHAVFLRPQSKDKTERCALELAQAYLEYRYNFIPFNPLDLYLILIDCFSSNNSYTYKADVLIALAKISLRDSKITHIDWMRLELDSIKKSDSFSSLSFFVQCEIRFFCYFYDLQFRERGRPLSQLEAFTYNHPEIEWRKQLAQIHLIYSGKDQLTPPEDTKIIFEIFKSLIANPCVPVHEKVFIEYSFAELLYKVYQGSVEFYMLKRKAFSFMELLHEEDPPMEPCNCCISEFHSVLQENFKIAKKNEEIAEISSDITDHSIFTLHNALGFYKINSQFWEKNFQNNFYRFKAYEKANHIFEQILRNPHAPLLYRLRSCYWKFKINVFLWPDESINFECAEKTIAAFSRIDEARFIDSFHPDHLKKFVIICKIRIHSLKEYTDNH